jgi:hypothetical protein
MMITVPPYVSGLCRSHARTHTRTRGGSEIRFFSRLPSVLALSLLGLAGLAEIRGGLLFPLGRNAAAAAAKKGPNFRPSRYSTYPVRP